MVNKPEVLDNVGEPGITIVLDKDPPPQPNEVAVITTVPDQPSAQEQDL